MNLRLEGKKVAILATDGFEQVELTSPKNELEKNGATVHIVTPKKESESIKGWDKDNWGIEMKTDVSVENANADDYNALVLPGGVMNPDTLRTNDAALDFIRAFFKAGKPVSAICHAPQLLIEAGVVEGRNVTSYKSIKTDLKNAGANWENSEVVTDEGLVTSRNPDDLPAFNDKMIEEIEEGVHEEQHA